jgi:pimeloyl-ACP methyl ester carboxylesterase
LTAPSASDSRESKLPESGPQQESHVARIDVNGIGIEYEILGAGDRAAVITPGGRFSKDTPGVRELAEILVADGMRVLIWDRPNTGASDICFDGPSESIQNADTLGGLLKALDFPPALLIGGSGGARDTLLTVIRHPEVARKAFVLWISGGALGVIGIAYFYTHDHAFAALTGGMEAVAALPGWKEPIERNPGNRDRILKWEPMAFFAKMQAWATAFLPQTGAPMPGVSTEQLAGIKVPITILRSGLSDLHHTRETSENVAALIPTATLAEPPWGDREWLDRMVAQGKGEGLFAKWPTLAPQILAFEHADQ